MIKTILNLPWIGPIVNHKLGGALAAVFAGALAHALVWLASLGIRMDPATHQAIAGNLAWAAAGLAGGAIQYVQTGSAMGFQDLIAQAMAKLGLKPIKVDGWIGKETLSGGVQVLRAIPATQADVDATFAETSHVPASLLPPSRR